MGHQPQSASSNAVARANRSRANGWRANGWNPGAAAARCGANSPAEWGRTRTKPSVIVLIVCVLVAITACTYRPTKPRAIDDLVAAKEDTDSPLYDVDARFDTKESAQVMLRQLQQAVGETDALALESRVVLQNDVWGLKQRLEGVDQPSPHQLALIDAAGRLIDALAPDDNELATLTQARRLPAVLDGYREFDSERVSLGHERLYGYRRLFRIFLKGEADRALVSLLVVLDRDRKPHLTSIIGEIEMLSFKAAGRLLSGAIDWQLNRARVFHRPRARLSMAPPPLLETDDVPHVPDLGANGFLARFDWPQRSLESLPCRRCHEDPSMMSLPSSDRDPTIRRRALLPLSVDALAQRALRSP